VAGSLLNERRGKRVVRGAREDAERPYTHDEVRKLLYSPFPMRSECEDLMRDALKVSLLSGMRLAEVLTLWVEEVREGYEGAGLVFDIQQGKTDAAARKVPVHPDLREIVERHMRGKLPKACLFHG
jgi:integrase